MTSRESELDRLLEVSTLLTSTLDLDPLLTKILETAESLMAATASNVMLLDPMTNELVYEVALGQAGLQIRDQKRLKVGVGIAGWVAQNNKPLLIEDAYSDPRFFPDFDKKTGFRTKSILCLPLKVKGHLIGVAQIINKKNAGVFTPKDQDLFSKFCNIAAVAIDNALLHRQILVQDRLKRDLLLAEEIQKASLPSQIPHIRNLRIVFRSMPCRQVGGDVLEISQIYDGKLAVLIADVSGKGVPAALFGAKFSTEYQYELETSPEGGGLFNRLNRLVTLRSTRGMFITAIYGVFDPNTGIVQIVNAGHPIPIIVGPKQNSIRLAHTEQYPPLGIVQDQIYNTTEIKLTQGEQLVFMTDGVTEAKAADGTRLGERAVEEALKSCPANAIARVMKAVKEFTGGESPADDVTIMGVRYGSYEEMNIQSDPAALSKVRELIEKRALEMGFQDKEQGRISLAVTEAIANIIKHTYAMQLDGQINIGIGRTDSELQIHIRDWGPKQDPGSFVSRKLEDIRPGGLGIHYMKQTMGMIEFDNSHREGNELFMMIEKKD